MAPPSALAAASRSAGAHAGVCTGACVRRRLRDCGENSGLLCPRRAGEPVVVMILAVHIVALAPGSRHSASKTRANALMARPAHAVRVPAEVTAQPGRRAADPRGGLTQRNPPSDTRGAAESAAGLTGPTRLANCAASFRRPCAARLGWRRQPPALTFLPGLS